MRRVFFVAAVFAGSAVRAFAQADDAVFRGTEEELRGLYREVAIFGRDDRVESLDAVEPWRTRARSVALMVDSWRVSVVGGVATLSATAYGSSQGLVPRTRFYGQPALPGCSAALIAPDLMLTAGHCVPAGGCWSKMFVFDFFYAGTDLRPTVPAASVVRCAGLVAGGPESVDAAGVRTDWAVVRIERALTDRAPLTVSADLPRRGDRLVMIGHPAGLPSKTATGRARGAREDGLLWADLDGLAGNSGSPVFDAAGDVIGVLARLPPDTTTRTVPARRRRPERTETVLNSYWDGFGAGAGIMPASRFHAELAPLGTATGLAGPVAPPPLPDPGPAEVGP
ncbi:MAG: serine protease [Elusimicrobiota bacterium]|nr:serine protease [Elusimicrobiota bacterium]